VSVLAARWDAIGTNVHLLVHGAPLAPARAALESLIDAADASFSRFRSDSELSHVNTARGRALEVGDLFGLALEAGLRGARLTNGLVDPTVGRLLRLAGYDADFGQVVGRRSTPSPTVESVAGWLVIEWDAQRGRVRLPAGVELDFGATGKALVVDLGAQAAIAASPPGAGVLVSIGGDIAVVGTPPAGGWRVRMAEDSRAPWSGGGEVAAVHEGGLATSSTTIRRWRAGHTTVHHLIDPRTGRPAVGPWRTVTAAAATCVDANICSTAAILLGGEAVAWLDEQGVPARLVGRDGAVSYVGPWAAPQPGQVGLPLPGAGAANTRAVA
jgi:thiamine biosynthesis lipoprotein